jgi:dTDP-4-amino-4,6-dideoxygalactose transaminase
MIQSNQWPQYDTDDIEAVSRILSSGKVNYWTGDEGRLFEREFAVFCRCEYAVAVANGSLALELALRSLDIGVGDEVVVTSRTFIASASSIVMVGATPVFADVDPDSQNITAETVKAVLSGKTRAIIAVHLAGWPCDMDGLMHLAGEHGLKVIEDCAQAHGAIYKGKPVGSLGHAAAWSFCQDKIMTTGGEGGMLTTNDESVWRKAWEYKDHGKSWDAVYNRQHPPGFRWLHESFGTNWRLTEMQSVIGRLQLKKMPEWHKRRTANAQRLIAICSQYPEYLRVPVLASDIEHAWYKFYVFVKPENLPPGWSRDRIMNEISDRGVPCFSGSCSEGI